MRCFECDGELNDAFASVLTGGSSTIEDRRVLSRSPADRNRPRRIAASRYLGEDRHIRLSIWHRDHPSAVIALEERGATTCRFLDRRVEAPEAASLVERLLTHVDELVGRRPA